MIISPLLAGIIAPVILALLVYVFFLHKWLFGRFGRFTSNLKLDATYTLAESTVYIVSFRKDAEKSAKNLARAFNLAQVVDAEEDIVHALRHTLDILKVPISAQVSVDRILTINAYETTPYSLSVSRVRCFLDHFACIDTICASDKRIESYELQTRHLAAVQSN